MQNMQTTIIFILLKEKWFSVWFLFRLKNAFFHFQQHNIIKYILYFFPLPTSQLNKRNTIKYRKQQICGIVWKYKSLNICFLLDQFECEIGWSFDGNNCSRAHKQSLVSLIRIVNLCVCMCVYVSVFKYSVTYIVFKTTTPKYVAPKRLLQISFDVKCAWKYLWNDSRIKKIIKNLNKI